MAVHLRRTGWADVLKPLKLFNDFFERSIFKLFFILYFIQVFLLHLNHLLILCSWSDAPSK